MKTDILKHKSNLTVKKGYNERETLSFDNHSLKYWYPLNVNYAYRYSTSSNDLYLTLIDSYTEVYDYGIRTKNRSKAKDNRIDPMEVLWYNDIVAEDNRYIMSIAKEHNVVTFDDIDDCTMEDVLDSYEILRNGIEEIKDLLLDRTLNHADETSFNHADKDAQDELVYTFLTEEEQRKLVNINKMYTMVSLVRKIKSIN